MFTVVHQYGEYFVRTESFRFDNGTTDGPVYKDTLGALTLALDEVVAVHDQMMNLRYQPFFTRDESNGIMFAEDRYIGKLRSALRDACRKILA